MHIAFKVVAYTVGLSAAAWFSWVAVIGFLSALNCLEVNEESPDEKL